MTCDPLKTGRASSLEYPEDLRRAARIYLGLRYVLGVVDWWHHDWIASCAGVPVGKIQQIAAAVEADRENRVIAIAIRHGLPLSALETLENNETYICRTCQHKRASVPCRNCAQPWPDELRPDLEFEEDRPLIRPDRPTTTLPGTRQKIEVMRRRVARGESPFHRNDPYSQVAYDLAEADAVSVFWPKHDGDEESG